MHQLNLARAVSSRLFCLCWLLVIAGCDGNQSDDGTDYQQGIQTDQTGQIRQVDDSACNSSYTPNEITDIILATGQSNLAGAKTAVSATFDRFGKVINFVGADLPHPRVFAWTVEPNSNAGLGWKIASLDQSWHDSDPGSGGTAHNSLVFHFAKQIANNRPCRVVGIVVVSESGKGIAHWDYGAPGWDQISRQVADALSPLGRPAIDGIIWHQGESDWIADGTCYPEGDCNNGQPDFYAQKLYSQIANPSVPNPYADSALIDRLRSQPWFGNSKPFIASETLQAPVNIHINKLNSDGDNWTQTVRGAADSGLEQGTFDDTGNHYSAAGLRELGARYASAYLRMIEQ